MSTYSVEYMMSRDIDWFFIINNKYPIYASSFGGILPSLINNRERNRLIQRAVWSVSEYDTSEYQLRDIGNDIQYDEQYVENSVRENPFEERNVAKRNYLQPFITMSVLGFYSFDKENLNDPNDNHYHLVSWPRHNDDGTVNPVKIDPTISQLLPDIIVPEDVVKEMLETRKSTDMVALVEKYRNGEQTVGDNEKV